MATKRHPLAQASLALSVLLIVPLLNFFVGAVVLYLGVKSAIEMQKHPSAYAGKWMAYLGIALGSLPFLLYLAGQFYMP